jgi:hypothetical protein
MTAVEEIYQLRYQLWLVAEGLMNFDHEMPPTQLVGNQKVGALDDVYNPGSPSPAPAGAWGWIGKASLPP